MENSKKIDIAFCIPTYNRAILIREFCEEMLRVYSEYGMDIYIYDSSENAETHDVIAGYQQIYDNLFYVKMNPAVQSNQKYYMILKQYGFTKKYKYLWICGDGLRYREGCLKSILMDTQNDVDFIIVDPLDQCNDDSNHIINDKNELFSECCPAMTMFGATLIRIDTVCTEVDWDELEAKYLSKDAFYYSHIGFFFEQLNKMSTFSAVHHLVSKNNFYVSKNKKDFNNWNLKFHFFCNAWFNTIMKLPDTYIEKEEVIKLLGSKYNFNDTCLAEYKIHGALCIKNFFRYYARWEKITDHSRGWLLGVSALSTSRALKMIFKRNRSEWEESRNIEDNVRLFSAQHDRVFLYGAGSYGTFYAEKLKRMGIECDGFVVTKKEEEVQQSVLPIFSIDEITDLENTGFIVATGDKYRTDIVDFLQTITDERNIFSESLVSSKERQYKVLRREYLLQKQKADNDQEQSI